MILISNYNIGDVVYVFREKNSPSLKEYDPKRAREIVLEVVKAKIYDITVSFSDTSSIYHDSYLGYILDKDDKPTQACSFSSQQATKNIDKLVASNIFGKTLEVKIIIERIYKYFT